MGIIMVEGNKKMRSLGTTISCLGGLLVCFNFTIWKDSEYGLFLSILAVVLAFIGIMLISKAKKQTKN